MIPKEVSSLQHPIVKTFVKLRTSRKFRYVHKQIVLAGVKQVSEARALEVLLLRKGFSLGKTAKQIYYVSEEILKKITGLESPEPVAATVAMPNWSSLEGKKKIVVFDGISDPGNLGTLLRTALALGWDGAFLTDDCVDPYNDKALRAAKGATLLMPIKMGKKEELLNLMQGYQAWVADMDGIALPNVKPAEKIMLILGNESVGVSEELKVQCDTLAVPITEMESLNVAAAGAILMYGLKNER